MVERTPTMSDFPAIDSLQFEKLGIRDDTDNKSDGN